MKVSYEIRTCRNTPVMAFNDLGRARDEAKKREKLIRTKLRVVEVSVTERDV